jgi:hypothetical protein
MRYGNSKLRRDNLQQVVCVCVCVWVVLHLHKHRGTNRKCGGKGRIKGVQEKKAKLLN